MPEVSASTSRTSLVNKRKSLLSELGIKPDNNNSSSNNTTAVKTSPGALTRKLSTTAKPSSPSVSKTKTSSTNSNSSSPPTSTPLRKKTTTPSAIKVDRNVKVAGAMNSPTSTPSPGKRSIVPANTNAASTTGQQNRRASISPPLRRGSINSVGSSNVQKRMSSPSGSGLESLMEVQTLKEQISQQQTQLTEQENEIQKLKLENQEKVSTLESELTQLKEEILATNTANEEKSSKLENDVKKRIIEETENKLHAVHKTEMEELLDNQDKKLQSELLALETEYEEKINTAISKHEQQYDAMKKEHASELLAERESSRLELTQTQQSHHSSLAEKDSLLLDLNTQIKLLQETQTNIHIRKLETEIETITAEFEKFKHDAQLSAEAIERRYRNEIRQLQSGTDDTEQIWLDKNKAAQQQVNELYDKIETLEQSHKKDQEVLKEAHGAEMEQLLETRETNENEIEAQSAQISELENQIEVLQNSLEEATVRLEQTAKTSPTHSSSRDDILNNVGSSSHNHLHQECLNRVDTKQKELEALEASMKKIKETHETQLVKLAQEKKNAVQELQKMVSQLEQENKNNMRQTPPTTPVLTGAKNDAVLSEERLIRIAEQHRKEIETMHDQYQNVVDSKNRELEDYAYRVKALSASKQKDIEKIQNEVNQTIDKYEKDIQGYEAKLIEYEKKSRSLNDNVHHWETISKNNEALIEDMKKECAHHLNETKQLDSLVRHLQSEIRH